MKKSPVYICDIKLIPKSLLYEGIQEAEIMNLARNIKSIYFTPGSASFAVEQKHQTQGTLYEKVFSYSFPGLMDTEDSEKLSNTGAVILKKDDNQNIILYKNDFFSNTKLRLEVDTNPKKTIVKGSILTTEL